jgi:hypothetical protein
VLDNVSEMNRRTFLTLPLLGFASSVAKPVYGDFFAPGELTYYSGMDWSAAFGPVCITQIWRNGELVAESEGK